ncbi:MAG: hypothetical protein DMG06_10115 [Acidobacteria bacterium]|nr:MAG: hypothetical protein DMG06_10115 [Acidobacteriota bacterium]
MSSQLKPLLVYDGDCSFCRWWIVRWKHSTGDLVEYAPFQEVGFQFPQIPKERFRHGVQLIEPSGQVFSGAEAVFRALAYSRGKGWMLWFYSTIPGVAALSEWLYQFISHHRSGFSKLTRFFLAKQAEVPTYFLSRWLFLRMLGAIFFIAFVSLWVQIGGLVGRKGILPAHYFLTVALERIGPQAYRLLPTLCWLNASDQFLQLLCGGGAFLSVLLIVGIATAPVLFFLWVFYLSLLTVCRDFLGFQWDALLLETSFLATFFAPLQIWPRLPRESAPSATILWLLRWLLFRLMFSSGIVKLMSGDPSWRNLTALNYHYETQCLPPWTAWYMHQLPEWFQKVSVAGMFTVELVVPFFIFGPRLFRYVAFVGLVGFQLIIMATGNYAFFNILAIALCVLLLDDSVFANWRHRKASHSATHARSQSRAWPRWVVAPLAITILLVTTMLMGEELRVSVPWSEPVKKIYSWLAPLCSLNRYGLFAVMTTTRPEIIVEGSNDGVNWLAYEFKYKPGDPARPPSFVAPHQPRLDWQMWFAALGSYQDHPWFINFCKRLLEGSPEVLALLAKNPFANSPPRYVRAVLYDYRFTDLATRRVHRTWWQREMKSLYCPVLVLPARSHD